MIMFSPDDFASFTRRPRLSLRDDLADLHAELYPLLRARRFDLHPPRDGDPLVVEPRALRLAYAKAETVLRWMQREFGAEWGEWARQATLGIRLDARGLSVELDLADTARVDAQNFHDKVRYGSPEKLHLRQMLAELGGAYAFVVSEAAPTDANLFARRELFRARCSRLVNLGVLNEAWARVEPGAHALTLATTFPPDDARLASEALVPALAYSLRHLYPLYQFAAWSPRNDFIRRPRADAQRES